MTLWLVPLLMCYSAVLLWRPALGPTDDYCFVSTLERHRPFPLWNSRNPFYDPYRLGRFSPLVGQEYNLVRRWACPRAYFLVNAVQLVIFAPVLCRLLQ